MTEYAVQFTLVIREEFEDLAGAERYREYMNYRLRVVVPTETEITSSVSTEKE